MEHVCWVAIKLNNLVSYVGISLRESLTLIKASFKLVSLHVKLIKWLAAALAVEGIVIHEVLNTTDHDRILEFTFTDGLQDELNEARHREALLHLLGRVDDSFPERVEHNSEKQELDDRNEDEPVD